MILYGRGKVRAQPPDLGLAAELSASNVAVNALAPFSVVWTPGAAASGLERYRTLPDWVEEPVEGMAEAAPRCAPSIRRCSAAMSSTATTYLHENGRAIRTLDGRDFLKNWKPAID